MASWREFFEAEKKEPYLQRLTEFLKIERQSHDIYPPQELVFNSMKCTPLDEVRVVIIGQDPYHGKKQAMGLCFSVPKGVPIPPSLRNIFEELQKDLGISKPSSGDLTPWAKQGVLLLNTLLTVQSGLAFSHKGRGWETFTDHLLEYLCKNSGPLVFLLWGKPAQDKAAGLEKRGFLHKNSLLLKAPHPSPLSAHRGFIGCGHFSMCNQWLKANGFSPIDWSV